ncbi:ExbD/TolR family protein [Polluticaenibacter yanchengensis]|uniref:Biopolymer transporter ExbD n=1 Tax=Polluticaenibacter yanchengensis TaxID=3014562 RepID=A0ABT4ULB2_9BACT|nr:biopolymer transporter ExbD [Chitinophagaceae bacterium LY-5]
MNVRRKLKREGELHTGALNDILFILLFFFLIVSTLANPNVIKVNNPKGKSDAKAKQSLVISINDKNEFYLGQRQINPQEIDSIVKFEVEKMKAIVDTPTVVVNADTISMSGGIFKVMQAAKNSGARIVANVKQ